MRNALIALLFLAACAPEQATTDSSITTDATTTQPRAAAPTPAEAAALLENSPELGEYEFTNAGWTTPTSGAAMSAPVRAEATQLAAAGWIAIDAVGDIALTAKSRNDKRFLLRQNGILDVVPLAKKQFGEVTDVRNLGGEVTVDFTWKWVPNEVGQAFKTGPTADRYATTKEARAELVHDGTKWVITQIKPRL